MKNIGNVVGGAILVFLVVGSIFLLPFIEILTQSTQSPQKLLTHTGSVPK